MTPTPRIGEAELHAYVDDELSADDRTIVEAALAADPGAAAEVAALRNLNDALTRRFEGRFAEPVPATLTSVLSRSNPARRWRVNWAALAAALAMLVTGIAAGAFAMHHVLSPGQEEFTVARPAVGAHVVYVTEVRHPVEVAAAEEAHLAQWLTKRLGADVRAPQLATKGFRLVGGRLLPDEGRPAAQFMYEDASGRRLTLYIRREAGGADTSFRLAGDHGVEAFYWIDRQLAYALVGQIPRDELLALSRIAYEQLN